MTPALSPTDIVARVSRDIERSALRARNGVRYVRGASRAKVGITPKDVVWERDRAQLWRYQAPSPIRYAPPVVIVHSLVSRSYILDLRPGNSMVEHLLGAGLDVYMLDWGVPDERRRRERDGDLLSATTSRVPWPRRCGIRRHRGDADGLLLRWAAAMFCSGR